MKRDSVNTAILVSLASFPIFAYLLKQYAPRWVTVFDQRDDRVVSTRLVAMFSGIFSLLVGTGTLLYMSTSGNTGDRFQPVHYLPNDP